MPSFSFKGFSTGSPVALSAAQGALSDSGSVTTWAEGTPASLTVTTVSAGSITAPAGIWFEVANMTGFDVSPPTGSDVYDPQFHEITYIWDFDDAANATPKTTLNTLTEWQNLNKAYGPKVAHTFNDPGTYTVSVFAYDRTGNVGYAEATVVVVDANTVYPTTQTIVFSNDGGETWADEPTGADRATTIASLQTKLNALTNPGRILFKRGQTVTDVALDLDDELIEYIGAWSTGADPILKALDGSSMFDTGNGTSGAPQLTVTEMDLRGGWDSKTETYATPIVGAGTPIDIRVQQKDVHLVVHQCSFDGFSSVDLAPKADRINTVSILSDCSITNWRNFGVFVPLVDENSLGKKLAIAGCSVAQHIDALNGDKTHSKNGLYNDHGPLRYASLPNVYIGASEFFSRNGWSGLSPDTADQPCLRINSEAYKNCTLTVDRVTCEGGFEIIEISDSNNTGEDPGNYLFDKVLMVATTKTNRKFMRADYGGITFRNLYAAVPNVGSYHTGPLDAVIEHDPTDQQPGNADAPIAIYNCTFLNLRDNTNDPGWAWEAQEGEINFNNVTLENNVIHGPDLDTPVNSDATIDTTTVLAGFTPRYKGVRFNFDHESGTLVSNVANAGAFTISYPAGTDQTYWQANGENLHHLRMDGDRYLAAEGDFSVSYDASVITITNNSGVTWNSGWAWELRLDRKGQIPAMDTTDASPATIPLPRPLSTPANSPAIDGGDVGRKSYDDFLGVVRPATGNERGAFLES